MNIHRGGIETLDVSKTRRYLAENDVDVAIIRMPADTQHTLWDSGLGGFWKIAADTLTQYSIELPSAELSPPDNPEIEIIECEDLRYLCGIDEIISTAFKGYSNHYYSNPVVPKESISEGYKEWTRSCIASGKPGHKCWVAIMENRVAGFMACAAEDGKAQIALNGIEAASRGRKIYGNILRKALDYYKKAGYESFSGYTQAHNLAAQRAWVREGFSIRGAFVTVHINSLLSFSAMEKVKISAPAGANPAASMHEASLRVFEKVFKGKKLLITSCHIEVFAEAAGDLEATVSFPLAGIRTGAVFATVKAHRADGVLSMLLYFNLNF